MSVRLILNPDSLERNEISSIWGQVYLEGDSYEFPEVGWTDIAVAFCTAWIQALQRISSGESEQEKVYFMDGPFRVEMRLLSRHSVELRFIQSRIADKVEHTSVQPIHELLENARSVAKSIIHTCQNRGWIDSDIKSLASAVGDMK